MRMPAPALPPRTVLGAMGIAIGGALVTVVLCVWVNFDGQDPSYQAAAGLWLKISLGLVLFNTGLLYAMWRRQRWAWGLTCALVILGVIADLVVFTPFRSGLGYDVFFLSPAWLLGGEAAPRWIWAHVALVEVPILVLLLAPPSRRWFVVDRPAPIPDGETTH